jgi:hypothetical protein
MKFSTYILILICCLPTSCSTQNALCKPYLKASEFENITNIHDSTIQGFEPLRFNGQLNVVDSTGQILLDVRVSSSEDFDSIKQGYFKRTIPEIGDQAFTIPKADPEYGIVFRKGSCTITVMSGLEDYGNKTTLTVDQLKQIALLIASRI